MNIFILDSDPILSVQYYVNKHVVKMILETAQLLSTAHRILDNNDDPVLYKKTHCNHPCAKWVRETAGNYRYAYQLFKELSSEYHYRYDKQHLSWTKLKDILKEPPKNISSNMEITPFALAMPEQYKSSDAVNAYRAYYNGEKRHMFIWKKRPIPYWVVQ